MPVRPLPTTHPMVKALEQQQKSLSGNLGFPKDWIMKHYEMAPFEINPNTLMQLRGVQLPPYAHDQEADLPPDPDASMEMSTYELARRKAKELDGPTDEEILNALANGLGQGV